MINPEYIFANAKLRNEIADLKIWLTDKEQCEYAQWKEENPKDRTAMDKVLASLKSKEENNEWAIKEDELRKAEILLTTQNNIMEILKKLISSVTYDKMSIEKFEEYQDNMSKWFM